MVCVSDRFAELAEQEGEPIANTAATDGITAAFERFVADARAEAAASGTWNEDRLTMPARKLLQTAVGLLGLSELAIVGKAAVTAPTEGVAVGFPDVSVYDKSGRVVLCVELKEPGKGADPEQFTGSHDKKQWQRYKMLPNLVYTDGNDWSLWHGGERSDCAFTACSNIRDYTEPVCVDPQAALKLLRQAVTWEPAQVADLSDLASVCANYCLMLRGAVSSLPEDLLEHISTDWKKLLFPDLQPTQFVDAYAQTVTFGLLTAGSLGIELGLDVDPVKYDRLSLRLHHISSELEKRRGLLGKALSLLTSSPQVRNSLHAHLEVLLAVVEAVDWTEIRASDTDTGWLHFYEDFLAQYDPALRKLSGSYYTPAGVVEWMTTFTDNLLEGFFDADGGYANEQVKVMDPALGTGTFLLSVLDRIRDQVTTRTGKGAVPDAAKAAAAARLIGFEIQSCPYSVAQLRIAEHLRSLDAVGDDYDLRVHLTDTLDDPRIEDPEMPMYFEALSKSRAEANRIKREEPIVVVIGNPPYLEHARDKGGWVEGTLLDDWKPPPEWGLSAHTKHLSNLYIYFWRWAAWKVFEDSRRDSEQADPAGIVSFIASTGFLSGAGFARMRRWLRRWCSDIWVLHLTPEGHHASAANQIFEAMRQPVAIVTAVRARGTLPDTPAVVRHHMVPAGTREEKLVHIATLANPSSEAWAELPPPPTDGQATESGDQSDNETPDSWRGPFLPPAAREWAEMPCLEDLLPWHGNGVRAGRTWPISPDQQSLHDRWRRLVNELDGDTKCKLFVKGGGQTIDKPLQRDSLLEGAPSRPAIRQEPEISAGANTNIVLAPYGYRSFDRQWIIRDGRVLGRPNPSLWPTQSNHQAYLKAPDLSSDGTRPHYANSEGIIVSFSEEIPDMHYLSGSRAGRVHPLWRDHAATAGNVPDGLLSYLSDSLGGSPIGPESLFAYIAAVVAHPGYAESFRDHLRHATEIHLPITADRELFDDAVALGRRVLWLHTYGNRFAQAGAQTPPRVTPPGAGPSVIIPLPQQAHQLSHDPNHDLLVISGTTSGNPHDGQINNVSAAVYNYTVADTNVLDMWFGSRKPAPSPPDPLKLDHLAPLTWPPSYTAALVDLLHVLTLLIDLQPLQQQLLGKIVAGPLITRSGLDEAGCLPEETGTKLKPASYTRPSEPQLPNMSE